MRAPLVLFTRGSVSRMSSESKGPPAALKGGTDQSEPFSLIRSQAGAVQHQNQLSQSRTLVCLKLVGSPSARPLQPNAATFPDAGTGGERDTGLGAA